MNAMAAFLQGDFAEEIYMEQPDGYKDGKWSGMQIEKKQVMVLNKVVVTGI